LRQIWNTTTAYRTGGMKKKVVMTISRIDCILSATSGAENAFLWGGSKRGTNRPAG
jgi:hypothetical protein